MLKQHQSWTHNKTEWVKCPAFVATLQALLFLCKIKNKKNKKIIRNNFFKIKKAKKTRETISFKHNSSYEKYDINRIYNHTGILILHEDFFPWNFAQNVRPSKEENQDTKPQTVICSAHEMNAKTKKKKKSSSSHASIKNPTMSLTMKKRSLLKQ